MRGLEREGSVNAAHSTGGSPAHPVHGVFQHSMVRRRFKQDYRDPFFYKVTITTHQRRPWFGVCENNVYAAICAAEIGFRDGELTQTAALDDTIENARLISEILLKGAGRCPCFCLTI